MQPPHSAFSGAFPSGFPSHTSAFGRRFPDGFDYDDDDMDFIPHHERFPQFSSHFPAQPHHHYPDQRPHHSQQPESSAKETTIPIRVIHERKKHPVRNSNTSPLPGSPKLNKTFPDKPDSSSPRLERAHSEPPKSFQQRIHINKHPDPIPEKAESNLQVPDSAHNLSTSASAPSVPSSSQTNRTQTPETIPENQMPELRARQSDSHSQRYPSRQPDFENPDPRKQSAPPTSGVRHIPIFVEGRSDPVVRRNTTAEFKKPSDYYPMGAKKKTEKPDLDLKNKPVNKPAHNEPTSPISPPPGPIPMGCSPSHLNLNKNPEEEPKKPDAKKPDSKRPDVKEPEPISKEPIPLPCSPNLLNKNEPEVQNPEEIPKPSTPKPEPENRERGKEEMELDKVEKIKCKMQELIQRINDFKGKKTDKEYLYLDDRLTRLLCELDSVESFGRDDIRSIRKESILTINRCLSMLDAKAKGEDQQAEKNNQILNDLAKMSTEDKKK